MDTVMTIRCSCSREVVLELIGGQYQDEYRGDCACGNKWFLKELSEALAEIEDDEEWS
jgi:hypothetical protein